MARRTKSDTVDSTEIEARAQLVYWVRDRMSKVGIDSPREMSRDMGVPNSNLTRWLAKDGGGGVPLVWLGELCRVLRVDPAWFTQLPPIPVDPTAQWSLDEDDPLLVALVAARHARRVRAEELAANLPVEDQPPARPRTRASQGGR